MKTLALKLAKYPKITFLILAVNLVIFIGFCGWFFTDIHLSQWGNTELTTSNVVEAMYLTKRDILWRNTLEKISSLQRPSLQALMLRAYIGLNPADQWWHPLYTYKDKAYEQLANYYRERGQWQNLIDTSQNHVREDPRNAHYYHLIGLGYENLDKANEAMNYYYQALEVESTHESSLVQLLSILIDRGDFDRAYELVQPYIKISEYVDREVCVYWGSEGFTADNKYCEVIISSDDTRSIYVDIGNMSSLEDGELRYLRFDIPSHIAVMINKVQVISTKDDVLFDVNDISDWIAYQSVIANNVASPRGGDPYIYTIFEAGIPYDSIANVQINYALKDEVIFNPELGKLVDELELYIND